MIAYVYIISMDTRASGEIRKSQPTDTITEELDKDLVLQRIRTQFTFDVDFSVPEVDVSDGNVLIIESDTSYILDPEKTKLPLEDSAINHIYIGMENSQITFHADTDKTPPPYSSVYIGKVNTTDNTKTAFKREGIGSFLQSFLSSDLPIPRTAGRMIWDQDRKQVAINSGSDWEVPVVANDVTTSSVTVSNTTDKEEIWSAELPENSMKKGRAYEVELFGSFSTAGSTDRVDITFSVNGTDVATVTSIGANVSDDPWRAKLIMTVQVEGGSGVLQPHSLATFQQQDSDTYNNSVDVDTTVVNTIKASAQWNNADSDNELTLAQAYFKQIH